MLLVKGYGTWQKKVDEKADIGAGHSRESLIYKTFRSEDLH